MIDGLWTLRTVSPSICSGSPLRASDPGAPFGHSTIVGWPGGMTTAGGLGAGAVGACAASGHASATARAIETDLNRLTGDAPGGTGELCAGLSHHRDQSSGAGGACSGARNWRTEAISDSDVDGLARTPSKTLFSGPS